MSNISMQVEFLAGTSIEDAVAEAKAFAIKLDIAYVKFDFNGVSMSIGQKANIQNAVKAFHDSIKKEKFKFVVENGR